MVTTSPNDNERGTLQNDAASASAADDERRNMRDHKERLTYDFKEMLSSAEALLRSTAKYTGAEVEEARTRLEQQLHAARERSGDVTESMRDAGQRLATKTDECVHNHPWTCIGAAFVLGMGAAHCMRR